MVRGFAQYCRALDGQTKVPPHGLLPYRYRRQPPYIYREQEIAHLLTAARQLHSPTGLRPYTYATLLGVLTVTGMRLSEVLHLERDDVELTQGSLRFVRVSLVRRVGFPCAHRLRTRCNSMRVSATIVPGRPPCGSFSRNAARH